MVTLAAAERKIGKLEDEICALKDELEKHQARAIVLTEKELEALPEYSCTIPTTYKGCVGMKWKRDMNEHIRHYERVDWPPRWVMGEYVRDPDPKMIGIKWTAIVVKGPAPTPKSVRSRSIISNDQRSG